MPSVGLGYRTTGPLATAAPGFFGRAKITPLGYLIVGVLFLCRHALGVRQLQQAKLAEHANITRSLVEAHAVAPLALASLAAAPPPAAAAAVSKSWCRVFAFSDFSTDP